MKNLAIVWGYSVRSLAVQVFKGLNIGTLRNLENCNQSNNHYLDKNFYFKSSTIFISRLKLGHNLLFSLI